jgi:hypothetical protein
MKLRFLTTYDDEGRNGYRVLQYQEEEHAAWIDADEVRVSRKRVCLYCGNIDCQLHFDK